MTLTKKQQRLLDAAPDMLKALQIAIKRADKNYKQFGHTTRTPECEADYQQCVAAIKKATGR